MKKSLNISSFSGLGAAFFPEHHARETWPEYVRLLAEAGLRFVRMFEFAWDKIEPREGEYDFSLMDEVMALLAERDIRVLMCTPTAVPPAWACAAYPDIIPEDEYGSFRFGHRRYTCPTSPSFRRLSNALVTQMARHFGGDLRVLGWQLDNELGQPVSCRCPRCLHAFRAWLQARFGSTERFNDALCTHFWGQTLSDFAQLPAPKEYQHPGIMPLYQRCYSDQTLDIYRTHASILRENGVDVPITTNMMLTWYTYDHEEMGEFLDVIAGDHYGLGPSTTFGDGYPGELLANAYLRGIRHGQSIWLTEFQCGRVSNQPLPGHLRWEVLTQVGLGTSLINLFRFDTSPSGAERDRYGLIGTSRIPGRVFHEVRKLTAELDQLTPHLRGMTRPPAEIGVLYTFENHVEFAHNHHPADFQGEYGNGYSIHLAKHFNAIANRNILPDIVYPRDDFARYRVIVAPALFQLPDALAEKLRAFVAGGGTLVLCAYSGVTDEYGTMRAGVPVPGPLAEVCGIALHDYGPTTPTAGEMRIISAHDGFPLEPISVITWLGEITPLGAETLACVDSPFFPGVPIVTRNSYGDGEAYFVSVLLGDEGYGRLYRALLPHFGLQPLLDLPEGIFCNALTGGDGSELIFLNNPNPEAREVQLPVPCTDILTGESLSGAVYLPRFAVRVLQRAPVAAAVH